MAYNLNKAGGSFKTSKVTSFANFVPNQQFEIPLITSRDITFIKGTLELDYTTGTAAPTAIQDGVAKLVNNLRLEYNGGAGVPIDTLGLQQLALYSQYLLNDRLWFDQPPTATGANGKAYVEFIISPSLDPKDPTNPMFCIPGEAPSINTIKLTGVWGNAASVWVNGANATINNASLTIDVEAGWTFGAQLDQAKNALGVDSQGNVYMPIYLTGTSQFTGAYGGLGLSIKMPTDVIVRNIFLIVKDSNGNRSDEVVSELAVRTSDNNDLFGVVDWYPTKRLIDDMLDINGVPGCLLLSCDDDIRDPNFANKLTGLEVKKADKLFLRYSTTAAGSIDFLFDCVRKVNVW